MHLQSFERFGPRALPTRRRKACGHDSIWMDMSKAFDKVNHGCLHAAKVARVRIWRQPLVVVWLLPDGSLPTCNKQCWVKPLILCLSAPEYLRAPF